MMIKGYISDMDGVIWNGDRKIAHAAERISELIDSGKKCFFVTNNASKSRDTYVARLLDYGMKIDKDSVMSAGYVAEQYIWSKSGPSKVYVLGTDDLKKSLVAGIDWLKGVRITW